MELVSNTAKSATRATGLVINTPIDLTDWELAIEQIETWGQSHKSKFICICNAHSVVTARLNARFASILSSADMATPDGAPVAWILRRTVAPKQQRINGPDLMWKYCKRASASGQSIYLYGASQETLDALVLRLKHHFSNLHIAGAYSPPFRKLTKEEDEQVVEAINGSGAGVVWVSLGCPKQEEWMYEHRGRINAVMIGVGAAFDYHAGIIQRAPAWMQRTGLEWLHRFFSEPGRLWKRYLVTNSLFIWFSAIQLLRR